ncbi:MAG: glycosyltransferase family 2 protein [Oscillospiraceae bacterium]|nr:glycosyltransferase family 2 protein [Oscillospiraceae bacterium]
MKKGLNKKMNITLSVGMIVKNEETRLEKCLAALSSLLRAVPSELVIVDTGSADKTIEIAGRYTDKIFHFDWVNDFAAARNFSLEKCAGEWFMYLDADEVFDDLSEMIAFFTDKKMLAKYNSATYIKRNYTNRENSRWYPFAAHRVTRRLKGLHFKYPIHECFSTFAEPVYEFKTFVHHYGYTYDTPEQQEAKRQRNLSLLRGEFAKNPGDIGICLHILQELAGAEKEAFYLEVLEKIRRNPQAAGAAVAFTEFILYLFEREGGEKTLGYIGEYFKLYKNIPENILMLDVYVAKGAVLQAQGKHAEAALAFENYFRLYGLYTKGRLNLLGLGGIALTFCRPEEYEKIKRIYSALPKLREKTPKPENNLHKTGENEAFYFPPVEKGLNENKLENNLHKTGENEAFYFPPVEKGLNENKLENNRHKIGENEAFHFPPVEKGLNENKLENNLHKTGENGAFHFSPVEKGLNENMGITLSVGMIVKNEEARLEKCLDALKPLLAAVPSELVITDTGSTDKTVEIAGRYTDKIFHFNWVNDFSAARNFGLEKCSGDWFMFLDADEVFGDLSELIRFFGDKQTLAKYNSATYFIRNHAKPDGSEWGDYIGARITRRVQGLHFINPIHERFSMFKEPTMHLKTVAHHWGYVYNSEAEKAAKDKRNIPLLREEINKKPNDPLAYLHLFVYLDSEEKEKLIPKIIEAAKKQNDNSSWLPLVLAFVSLHYYNIGDFDKALDYNYKFFKAAMKNQKSLLYLEMYAERGIIAYNRKEYSDAITAFENYFKFYELYTDGKLNIDVLGILPLSSIEEAHYNQIKQLCELSKGHENIKRNTSIALNGVKSLSYKYDKNIVLSVSMIVKNEERMLGACLEGLKPLLDAVPSELVIVDTGSTDRTVEIAKQFTDKIYHFDWIDDFGAARNFGLEKCSGMWFMFLDADDHFQDVSEMIKFFSDINIHKNYNVAYYITRNFTSAKYDKYFSFYVQRIARKTDDLRFEGAIHEAFAGFYNPAYYFSSYAHHYGYAFETMEQQRKKSMRNLMLLEKELEKKPDDLRTIGHMIDSMMDMDDKKRAFVEKAVALSDKSGEAVSYPAYFKAFDMYYAAGEVENALAVMDKVITKAKPDNGVLTEAYAYKGSLLFETGRFSEAGECIKKYLEYLEKLGKGKLDRSVLTFLIANYSAPEKRGDFVNLLAMCISKQGKTTEALAVYAGTDFAGLPAKAFRDTTGAIFEIINALKNKSDREAVFKTLAAFYEKVQSTKTDEKVNYFEQALEKLYYLNRDDNIYTESFKDTGGKFAELMRLTAESGSTEIESFINSFGDKPVPEGFSAAVELALKNNVSLGAEITKMNLELMRTHLAVIAQNSTFLPVHAIGYQNDAFFFSSIKNLLFGTLLFEAACYNTDSLTEPQKSEVYNRCVNYCSLYVSNVYNPDLLNEDDIGALSESHRFGYFMGIAKKLLDSGDRLGYIRELKKALASCNSMQNIIKFLIEEFSASL